MPAAPTLVFQLLLFSAYSVCVMVDPGWERISNACKSLTLSCFSYKALESVPLCQPGVRMSQTYIQMLQIHLQRSCVSFCFLIFVLLDSFCEVYWISFDSRKNTSWFSLLLLYIFQSVLLLNFKWQQI